ncbi:MAG: metallophosphoesterase [Actinomycetia bacterium]|nr:metallophosphoesterase [Actinomycetes bacterium]
MQQDERSAPGLDDSPPPQLEDEATFVALGDVHLDTPFAWAPEAVSRMRRNDLRDVLSAAVAVAAEVQADALLLAGDIYEHERVTPDTARFIARVLNGCETQVLVSPGNHDWLAASSVWATAAFEDHVHIFDGRELEPFDVGPTTVWGAAHHQPSGTGNFLDGFHIDRPGFNLALFHGSEKAGFSIEEPEHSGSSKQPHAPFEARQIPNAGLDHAVVGHFHRRREAIHHTYPGNPAPLAFGEPGDGGAVVLHIDAVGGIDRQWRDLSQRSMHDIEIDVSGCLDASAIRDVVAARTGHLEGLIRLNLTGEVEQSIELVDSDLLSAVGASVDHAVVRRSKLRQALDLTTLRGEASVRGQFVRAVLEDPTIDDETRYAVLATGLRALDGRRDLDVAS